MRSFLQNLVNGASMTEGRLFFSTQGCAVAALAALYTRTWSMGRRGYALLSARHWNSLDEDNFRIWIGLPTFDGPFSAESTFIFAVKIFKELE